MQTNPWREGDLTPQHIFFSVGSEWGYMVNSLDWCGIFPRHQTLVVRAEHHAVDKIGVLNQMHHHLELGMTFFLHS